jgi:thiol-disulfide isomerase/thioredoxin
MEAFLLSPATQARPEVVWTDQSGAAMDLSNFAGKVVLVNFWASWCDTCETELPTIAKLKSLLGTQDFAVVGINTDQAGGPVARRAFRKLGIGNLDIYLDRSNRASRSFGVTTIPTSIIFDREGREVGKIEQATDWSSDEAVELIRFFIDNPGYAAGLPIRASQN